MLRFTLTKECAVLVTYTLPVSQFDHPRFDSDQWFPLSRVDSRIVVDGVAYWRRHSRIIVPTEIISKYAVIDVFTLSYSDMLNNVVFNNMCRKVKKEVLESFHAVLLLVD